MGKYPGYRVRDGYTPFPIYAISTKGEIKSKSRLARHRFSQKTNGRICFVFFFTLHRKQIKFVRSFFRRIYGVPICFLILSHL